MGTALLLSMLPLTTIPALGEREGTASSAVPAAHPESRYQSAWQRSPFERKTAPPAVSGRQANFADELELISLMRRDGRLSAQLKDRATGSFIRVTEQPAADGLHIVDANLVRDPRGQSVTLAQGSQTGVVRRAGATATRAATAATDRAPQRATEQPEAIVANRMFNSPEPDPGTGSANPAASRTNPQAATADRPSQRPATRSQPTPDSRRRLMIPGSGDGEQVRGRVIRPVEGTAPGEPLSFHIQVGGPDRDQAPGNPAAPRRSPPAGPGDGG